ncbi:MAG: type II toxin-antitoxin system PemK/MazF family toxin [Actinomycetota bacterium]|nr:type II toxin-antitoxin system PemK/MazF family toxin [Actinomycetota bacterium]MDA8075141.1 type II toxin-antitoxin system PemK/MazF family toxin [Actinomycetota bacterium]
MVARGEVWWTDFGDPVGSSPGYRRPAVVISSDRFNRSRITTVIVAAITSNTRLSREPGNVTLPDDLLPKPSVVNVTALFTVDRDQLVNHVADLPPLEARVLDDGLRLVLSL